MTTNTMHQRTRRKTFTTVDGVDLPTCGLHHKLIDFGFSSLEIGGKRIMSAAFQHTMDFKFVHKPERDMMQLLYYILRYNWIKLSPNLIYYICNLLTVLRDAVNLFGFIAVPECICFWKTHHKDAVQFRKPNNKSIRVQTWADLYAVVGQATFRNPKTTPDSILSDIARCMTPDKKYDAAALASLRDVVTPTVVEKYFAR